MRAVLLVSVCISILVACGSSEPKSPHKTDEVPANSLNDAKLHDSAGSADEQKDPTQPLTTKVGDAPLDPSSSGGAASASGGSNAKPNPNAASKAECDKAMDKYLTLEIAGNPQLKGVPPDVIEQAKQMAREQHGDAPCTATKSQTRCAMGASTTAAWQKCMK